MTWHVAQILPLGPRPSAPPPHCGACGCLWMPHSSVPLWTRPLPTAATSPKTRPFPAAWVPCPLGVHLLPVPIPRPLLSGCS